MDLNLLCAGSWEADRLEFLHDLILLQQMDPGRQNRGFKYRVLGPVEAHEIVEPPHVNHAADNVRAVLGIVEFRDFELIPPAGRLDDLPLDFLGGEEFRQLRQRPNRRLGQQQHIIHDVKHTLPVELEVLIRP